MAGKIKNVLRLSTAFRDALFTTDKRRRYEGQYQLLSVLTKKLGFRLYNTNLYWQNDNDYLDLWKQFQKNGASIKDRKYVLYSMAKAVSNLPGDTVECGVFDGGGSFLICSANACEKDDFFHHMFDSFEGLSKPTSNDIPEDPKSYVWKEGDLSVPLEIVEQNLRRFNFVKYHKGWIPDRFHEVADRKFSFVHVDVDLYQPTYDSIKFFYERTVTGGIILCDDYGSIACPGAKQAFDELVQEKPERSVIHLTTGQGFIIKQ